MIGVVTAVLNLDTSVAFLTPVLVYAARSRGGARPRSSTAVCCCPTPGRCSSPAPTSPTSSCSATSGSPVPPSWPGCGHRRWPPWVVTACGRRRPGAPITAGRRRGADARERPTLGLGLVAVVAATLLVLALHSPALPVAVVGVVAIGIRLAEGGTASPTWSRSSGCRCSSACSGWPWRSGRSDGGGRARPHCSPTSTCGGPGAGGRRSVLVNNLPAASLLAARTTAPPVRPAHRPQPAVRTCSSPAPWPGCSGSGPPRVSAGARPSIARRDAGSDASRCPWPQSVSWWPPVTPERGVAGRADRCRAGSA